jgi:glucose/mannose transport system substrate-binding protein
MLNKKVLFHILAVLMIASLVLTACAQPTPEPTEAPAEPEEPAEPAEPEEPAPAEGGELEIYSWLAGDEGPALEALIAAYGEMYPDVEVINATVAGGSGTEAKAVLKTRMLGGDPPDTFQVHAGQELIGTWVVADAMEDLTSLYEEQGWFDKYPQGLIDMMSTEDGVWSVPVNIHRSNVLWYIPANLEGWGVEAPETWDDFPAICPTLQEQGVIPLALGRNWTHNHLWEAVALSELGVDGWNALWSGEKAFTDPDVVATWDLFGEILACTNEDATSLSWQQATDMVISGDAAFNEMGDWAMTYFTVINGLEPGTDYAWVASPGTDGVFMALSDSFGLPKGAPNPDNVLNWLRLMGSVEGQDAFNPLKGSIAAHFDSDLSLYNAYGQNAAESWANDTVVGSLAHGAVANENFMNGFASAMEIFLSTGSPEATSNALQELAVESEIYTGEAPEAVAPPEIGTEDNPIKVLFVPSVDVDFMIESGALIEQALSDATGLVYEVSVPTSYAATIEEMCASPDDTIGFIPAMGYALASQLCGVEPGLASVRFGWNVYFAQFIAGRDSGIETLADLEGKSWGFGDTGSTSGYLVPLAMLNDLGITPGEQVETGGHTETANAVYNGEVDFGTTFFSPPLLPEGEWQEGDPPDIPDELVPECGLNDEGQLWCGGYRVLDARQTIREQAPDVVQKVKIVDISQGIPNDTMSFGPDFPDELKDMINEAVIAYVQTEACQESLCNPQFYEWTAAEYIFDENFDLIRIMMEDQGITLENIGQ